MPVLLKVGKVQVKLTGLNAMIQTIETRSVEPLQQIRTYMLGRIQRNFASEGRLFKTTHEIEYGWGGFAGWQPLSPATERIKAEIAKSVSRTEAIRIAKAEARGAIPKSFPLIRTGKMAASFYGHIVRRPGGRFRLIITNTAPYFRKHQSMRTSSRMITNLAGKKMPLPRRVMMRIMVQDQYRIVAIYKNWLNRHIKKQQKKTSIASTSKGDGFVPYSSPFA